MKTLLKWLIKKFVTKDALKAAIHAANKRIAEKPASERTQQIMGYGEDASVLTAAYLRGRSLVESTSIAAEFVRRTIRKTDKNNPNLWYGVNFEGELSSLASLLS